MIEIFLGIGIVLSLVGWIGCLVVGFHIAAVWGIFILFIPFGSLALYARARSQTKPWVIIQVIGAIFMMPYYAQTPLDSEQLTQVAPNQYSPPPVPTDDSEEEEESEEEYFDITGIAPAQLELLRLGERMGPGMQELFLQRQLEIARAWHGVLMQRTRLFELLPEATQMQHRDELVAYQMILQHAQPASSAEEE